MALFFSQFPLCPYTVTAYKSTFSFPITPKHISNPTRRTTIFASKPLKYTTIPKASREEDDNNNNSKGVAGPDSEFQSQSEEISELEIKINKAMKERGRKCEADFFSGVAEEIREIEWPSLNKVFGTTWVVLGVIAVASVVLLTLNVVLAALSDSFFAGKGVQDFFG